MPVIDTWHVSGLTPAHASYGIQWGDALTWALAVIALAALIAAVLAYRKQADAASKLADQVDLQREQLTDQQEANSKQAEVLEAQLRDIRQRERIIERQQANEILLTPTTFSGTVPGVAAYEGRKAHAGEIANKSERPIRDVSCRIERAPGEGLHEAVMTGQLVEMGMPPGARAVARQEAGSRLSLIRAGEAWMFIFRYDVDGHPDATMTARFTDCAGLYWQIDHDLHLEKLDNRDDW
jgi:hypothetical protein